MTVNKLRIRSKGSVYEVPTKDYVDNYTGGGASSSQSINLSDMPVGYITWQMALMENYLKLDGTNLANASTSYKELLGYAQDNELITADTTDKSLFKYDSTTDVLTLPNYIDLVLQGGNTVEEKEAGLPNITGEIRGRATGTVDGDLGGNVLKDGSGAFSALKIGTFKAGALGYNSSTLTVGAMEFKASQSNPIYGNSTTVQPPAITLIPQIKYRKADVDSIFYNDSPIGTIIAYMGITAPKDYLACDGQTYNIVDYKELAEYIKRQFGTYNYFGGDGTTTFAVPDLRGEFLRGTGTNSHTNQGSGDNVGVHQDGTASTAFMVWTDPSNKVIQIPCNATDSFGTSSADSVTDTKDGLLQISGTYISASWAQGRNAKYTSRPTNTSVLYCIKYNTSVLSTPENNYSTEEQRIGTWIDGKPLYQITIVDTMPVVSSDGTIADKNIDISSLSLKYLHNAFGYIWRASSGLQLPINSAPYLSNSFNYFSCVYVTRTDLTKDYYNTFIIRSNGSDDSNESVYITLQYTKTTD